MLTTLYITVHVIKKGKNDKLRFKLKAWFGLIHIRAEVPILQILESGARIQVEGESTQKKLIKKQKKFTFQDFWSIQYKAQLWLKNVINLQKIAKQFLKTIRLEKLNWHTAIGTGDAAETGVLTGAGWGIKSTILGFVSQYITLRSIPNIHVQPHFQETKVESEFLCMIRFRIGHIIIAGIRMLINLRKRRDTKWQNTPFKA